MWLATTWWCFPKRAVAPTSPAYYYTDINQLTGVPTSANWVKMTTGFINAATRGANDIFVVSPNEIYFPADGGYIYKSTDITQGVAVNNAAANGTNNLTRMHGYGSTYVAVGASATVSNPSTAAGTGPPPPPLPRLAAPPPYRLTRLPLLGGW
jgi:hypothetical protein